MIERSTTADPDITDNGARAPITVIFPFSTRRKIFQPP